MSEHHFGVGRRPVPEKLVKRIERIAAKHDANFITAKIPGTDTRYWFTCQNLGEPFNSATARAVLADLKAAGIELP